MLEGLYSAAAGMSAQQEALDAISNDLANVNTNGFKSERVAFNDLLYNQVRIAGSESTIGSGSSAAIVGRSKAQGALRETGNPLDLAIEGTGFFKVTGPGGQTALTRDGALALDASGTLVTGAGYRLEPPIKVPAGVSAEEVSVAADGTVSARGKALGRIELVSVTSPDHMTSLGSNLLLPTSDSGAPHAVQAHIKQGALEQSNVDLGTDVANLVSTQRSFQMESTALSNASQMMSIANQLRP
jgi:flagellar basal-body rod protein FlgG